mgnify:CR=1 FL=1
MSRIVRASTGGGGTTVIIQTAAQWALDIVVYPATNLLVTSDSYFGATDQRKFKIADGVQTWTQLNYIPISGYDDATSSIQTQLNAGVAYTDSSIATEVTNRNNAIASAVAGLMDYRGVYDASVNAYPSSGGSGVAGAIMAADFWIISVSGTLPTGVVVEAGDLVIAKIDTPGNTQANWSVVQYNIGYTPENATNKSTDVNADQASNVKYPTVKAVYDWATGLFATISSVAANLAKVDKGSIVFLIDNNGAAVVTGTKADTAVVSYGGIITGWQLFETSATPVSCTATLDVYRDSYTNYPPVVGDALTWTKPSLTAATKNSASGLSIAFTAQDGFRVNVDSNNSGVAFKLVLFTQKTS